MFVCSKYLGLYVYICFSADVHVFLSVGVWESVYVFVGFVFV